VVDAGDETRLALEAIEGLSRGILAAQDHLERHLAAARLELRAR